MKNIFINSKDVDVNGTHFIANIQTTYQKLVEVFGEETHGMSGDQKCECQWKLLFLDGTIATIYDWKTNKTYCKVNGVSKEDNTNWTIGGANSKSLSMVEKELKKVQ